MEEFFEKTMNVIVDLLYGICCILCFGFNFNVAGYIFTCVIIIRIVWKLYSDMKEKRK
jgi:hypothetical protein